jgi:hypothetical protein
MKMNNKFTFTLSVLLLCLIFIACNFSERNERPESRSNKPEATRTKPESKGVDSRSDQTESNERKEDSDSPRLETNGDSDNPRVEICKRYESCGCQSYESCMQQLENDTTPEEPGVKECIAASTCESLCAGKPDGCPNRRSQVPETPNCSGITCSRDSDCPGACHGGCSDGRCYLF